MCARVPPTLQCEQRADGSQIVRLTLPPGVSSSFSENDVLLLSRDNPVRGRAWRGVEWVGVGAEMEGMWGNGGRELEWGMFPRKWVALADKREFSLS